MEKMPAPELEVISFNTEDIIVTSGLNLSIPGESLMSDWRYVTLGSELQEVNETSFKSGKDIVKIDKNSKYLFMIGSSGNVKKVDLQWSSAPDPTYYAWHYGNSWYTGSLTLSDSPPPPLSDFTEYYSN